MTFDHDEQEFLDQFGSEGGDYALSSNDGAGGQIGFLGANSQTGRNPVTIYSRGDRINRSSLRDNQPFKVVSFYTQDSRYTAHAERLRASLDNFNLDYVIEPVADHGAWEKNCAYKSEFILKAWRASPIPVVWLDADATLTAEPELFARVRADFGLHKWTWDHAHADAGWEFCSGTLYFGKSPLVEALLNQWALRCRADPMTWDQVHLCSAWCDISATSPLQTVWLPRAYLHIDGAPELEPPVIRHWQASRELRSELATSLEDPLKINAHGIADRRDNRLWRSREELFWIGEGTENIIPASKLEFPEGFDVGAALDAAIDKLYPVLEIGCGTGRIASLFEPKNYVGIDVNPSALISARTNFPNHIFRIHDLGYEYPAAPTAMFYTVLLHVSDDRISEVLSNAVAGRQQLVIAELMDRRWRRGGNPPVFNRDPEDYILLMRALGWNLIAASAHEYERYACEPWNIGRDSRLKILVFKPATDPYSIIMPIGCWRWFTGEIVTIDHVGTVQSVQDQGTLTFHADAGNWQIAWAVKGLTDYVTVDEYGNLIGHNQYRDPVSATRIVN